MNGNTFNSPLEFGLRTLIILVEVYPKSLSIQKLSALDYLLTHSNDIDGGPEGVHPKTPRRSEEFFIKRKMIQDGINLFQRKGLIEQQFESDGLTFVATELSGCFLDSLKADYTNSLKNIASWAIETFGNMDDTKITQILESKLSTWGTEFTMESVLWQEEY
ncbi:ABC-three component system middle component 2 [Lentisphaerota bacterium WC36G]|nr:hypothetical protein LJT99_02550 [Lentisphaerae bacterium WC36]